jgi:phospholipid/cholesterol/gamma-HCH transport system substrate-binding protein
MKEKWFFVFKTVFFLLFSFVLLGTVILFLGKEGLYFKKTFILKTKFQSVAGLSQEAPVYRSGFLVGRVGKFEFLEDGMIEITMSIDKEYHRQFRQGCYARIVPVGILGDKAIDIVGGISKAPILAEGSNIISVEPFDLADIASQVEPLLKEAKIIANNLAEITGTISQEHTTYQHIFRNVEKITDKIAKGEGTLGALVQDDELYKEASTAAKKTWQMLDKTNEFVESLQTSSKPILVKGEEAAKNLTSLLVEIENFVKDLDKWLNRTDPVIDDLSWVTSEFMGFIPEFRRIVRNFSLASEGAVDVIEAAKKNRWIRPYLPKEK